MPQKRYDPHFKLYLPQHIMDALKHASAATGVAQQQICRLALADYFYGPDPEVPNQVRPALLTHAATQGAQDGYPAV